MIHSKAFSDWVLVHMHHKRNLSVNEIERLTGLKSRSIQRVLNLFEETGQVMPPAAKSGRPGKLDDNDIVSDPSRILFSGHTQGPFRSSNLAYHTVQTLFLMNYKSS
jgi:hypothetical protein